jgi:predicted O-linked N-acetylglucosamine transferase (SPINDLY family)
MALNTRQILEEAMSYHKQRQFDKAVKLYNKVLKADKKNYKIVYMMGEALYSSGKKREAIPHLLKVVKLKPDYIQGYCMLSAAYLDTKAFAQALGAVDKGLSYDSQNIVLLTQKAIILCDSGRASEGLPFAKMASKIAPDNVDVIRIEARCCLLSNRFKDAIEKYSRVIGGAVNDYKSYNCIGTAYKQLGNDEAAIEWFKKTIEINADYVEAYNNVGSVLAELKKYDEALKYYTKAIELRPGYIQSLGNKASVLRRLGFFEEAVAMFKDILENDDSHPNFYSNYLMAIHYMDTVSQQEIYDAQLAYDKKYCQKLTPKKPVRFENDLSADKVLRVGMLSSSFMRHPVGYMILPMLDHIDKQKVEFFVYSNLAEEKKDDFTQRIKDHTTVWHDTLGQSDQQILQHLRDDKIDIALELTGHAEGGNCLSIIARRAAPVQVKWIGGLFNTSGLQQMDWIIGDAIEIPEGEEKWYTERVYRMPDDYICYEPVDYAGDVQPLPALENGYITFGNLNNPSKINQASISLWAEILKEVAGSKMLFSGKAYEVEALYNKVVDGFKECGVDQERLIFEYGGPHKDFIKTYNRIDIAIAPYPYSGGLTTCESLWLGVPVIALPGPTFAGKHAATHLHNSGYADWIVIDRKSAVELAKKWAEDLDGLSKLRGNMREQVASSPLVDGARFAKNFEIALHHMWQEYIKNI